MSIEIYCSRPEANPTFSPGVIRSDANPGGACPKPLLVLALSLASAATIGRLPVEAVFQPVGGSAASALVDYACYRPTRQLQDLEVETLRRELRELRRLGPNWDSYGSPAPSERAIGIAASAIAALHYASLFPKSVRPTSDESIMLQIPVGDVCYLLEIYNDGDIVLSDDREGGEPARDVVLSDLVDEMRRLAVS
jgi:hypothetical protein